MDKTSWIPRQGPDPIGPTPKPRVGYGGISGDAIGIKGWGG